MPTKNFKIHFILKSTFSSLGKCLGFLAIFFIFVDCTSQVARHEQYLLDTWKPQIGTATRESVTGKLGPSDKCEKAGAVEVCRWTVHGNSESKSLGRPGNDYNNWTFSQIMSFDLKTGKLTDVNIAN